jgi:hypothetical protein
MYAVLIEVNANESHVAEARKRLPNKRRPARLNTEPRAGTGSLPKTAAVFLSSCSTHLQNRRTTDGRRPRGRHGPLSVGAGSPRLGLTSCP